MTEAEAMRFLKDRLATNEWWIIPIASDEAADWATELRNRFYTGDNSLLFDLLALTPMLPDLPVLLVALASKSCLTSAQLGAHTGTPVLSDGTRDVLIASTTPVVVVCWLAERLDDNSL